MNDKDRTKDWRELCKAAVAERDPNKFMDLIAEINKALDELDRMRKLNSDREHSSDGSSLQPRAAW